MKKFKNIILCYFDFHSWEKVEKVEGNRNISFSRKCKHCPRVERLHKFVIDKWLPK